MLVSSMSVTNFTKGGAEIDLEHNQAGLSMFILSYIGHPIKYKIQYIYMSGHRK